MTIALGLLAAAMLSTANPTDSHCEDLTEFDTEGLARYEFTEPSMVGAFGLSAKERVRIGEVRVVLQPIFDADNPDEDRWLYRTADALHVDTGEAVIRQVILFEEGATVAVGELIESERILRAKPYLFDARVLPRRLCGETLDVDVVTRDVWTLLPRVDVSRSGGDDSFGVGLSDVNILGTGQELSAGYASNEDRKGVDLFYYDPNVARSRVALSALLADFDDGSRQFVELRQPFYALDTPYAVGAMFDRVDQEEGLYFRNDEYAEFQQRYTQYGVSGGVSFGRRHDRVRRLSMGYRYEEHRFSEISGQTPPLPFPRDRTFAYPWIGFESVEDEYEVAVNVDRIERTEDLYVGERMFAELGYSSDAFGADDARRGVYRIGYQDSLRPDDRHLFTFGASGRGYWNFDSNEEEELIARAFGSYRHQQTERFSFASAIEFIYTSNLFDDQQLLLGGDTGLRGYPSRYQAGDRRFVVSLEERYFSDVYLMRLLRVGYAAFIDVGRSWFPGEPDADEYGVLANVGFGLRLESTRTRRDRILHIDLAAPLVDGRDVDSVQLSFTVKSQL